MYFLIVLTSTLFLSLVTNDIVSGAQCPLCVRIGELVSITFEVPVRGGAKIIINGQAHEIYADFNVGQESNSSTDTSSVSLKERNNKYNIILIKFLARSSFTTIKFTNTANGSTENCRIPAYPYPLATNISVTQIAKYELRVSWSLIDVQSDQMITITVFSFDGQPVWTRRINANRTDTNILASDLTPGRYYLVFTQGAECLSGNESEQVNFIFRGAPNKPMDVRITIDERDSVISIKGSVSNDSFADSILIITSSFSKHIKLVEESWNFSYHFFKTLEKTTKSIIYIAAVNENSRSNFTEKSISYPLYPNIVVVEHENWVNITICLDDLDVYSSEVEFLNQTSYKRFDIGWKCAVYNFTVSLSGIETYAVSAIVSTTDNITYVFKDKVFKRNATYTDTQDAQSDSISVSHNSYLQLITVLLGLTILHCSL